MNVVWAKIVVPAIGMGMPPSKGRADGGRPSLLSGTLRFSATFVLCPQAAEKGFGLIYPRPHHVIFSQRRRKPHKQGDAFAKRVCCEPLEYNISLASCEFDDWSTAWAAAFLFRMARQQLFFADLVSVFYLIVRKGVNQLYM